MVAAIIVAVRYAFVKSAILNLLQKRAPKGLVRKALVFGRWV